MYVIVLDARGIPRGRHALKIYLYKLIRRREAGAVGREAKHEKKTCQVARLIRHRSKGRATQGKRAGRD